MIITRETLARLIINHLLQDAGAVGVVIAKHGDAATITASDKHDHNVVIRLEIVTADSVVVYAEPPRPREDKEKP